MTLVEAFQNAVKIDNERQFTLPHPAGKCTTTLLLNNAEYLPIITKDNWFKPKSSNKQQIKTFKGQRPMHKTTLNLGDYPGHDCDVYTKWLPISKQWYSGPPRKPKIDKPKGYYRSMHLSNFELQHPGNSYFDGITHYQNTFLDHKPTKSHIELHRPVFDNKMDQMEGSQAKIILNRDDPYKGQQLYHSQYFDIHNRLGKKLTKNTEDPMSNYPLPHYAHSRYNILTGHPKSGDRLNHHRRSGNQTLRTERQIESNQMRKFSQTFRIS